jgi:hypothetical protein
MNRKKKWIFYAVLSIALMGSAIWLPQILSDSIGKPIVIQFLQAKTHAAASIQEVRLSWFGPQEIKGLQLRRDDLELSVKQVHMNAWMGSLFHLFALKELDHIHGDLTVMDASFLFLSPESAPVCIEPVQVLLRVHADMVDFTANGQQKDASGRFFVQGQIRKSQDKDVEYTIREEVSSFPVLPIARLAACLFGLNERAIVQILAEPVQLDGTVSYSQGLSFSNKGMFDGSFHTPNIDLEVHGDIANNALTLRQPLTGAVRMTPALGKVILRDINPLWMSAIQSTSPIQLRIEPTRFYCPLPIKLKNIEIGQGMIDVGQIRCRNNGVLASLIFLFQPLNQNLSASTEINAWFTPLFFNLENGVFQTSRVDALIADSIHICWGGSIYYLRDKLDMYVGLPADTLKKYFGIRNLSDTYVLKIPLTGSLCHPSLAVKGAAEKMAALFAAQNSPHNWLTEGLFHLLEKPDKNIPPPHRPFPWENQ